MEHLNVFVFYVLGQALENCRTRAQSNVPLNTYHFSISLAHSALSLLQRGGAQYRLNESAQAATQLSPVLEDMLAAFTANPDGMLTPDQVGRLNQAVSAFDNAINVELGRAPIFWVKPKSVFDTRVMITRASMVYSDGVAANLPREALEDTDHAGRCIAFSLGTAAGFHIARATEAVIKRYMEACGCPPPKESQRNWGHYIKTLNDHGANRKVTAHLEQIKDLHRNPLIHPEVTLGLGEAVTLWAICTSAIHAMIADMETKKGTPADQAMLVLPPGDDG